MPTLYRKQATGAIGTWRIWRELDTVRIAHALVEGGQEVIHTEHITTNLSGRTLQEQIELRIKSRISRMLDKGYKYTRGDALAGQTNQLGLLRPMLAQKFVNAKNIRYEGAMLQKKLDGHRCMITKNDGDIIAYSRQGKLITTITHVTDYLRRRIPEGTTIDGELYLHGYALQTLASWIKRKQKDSERLMFVAYDIVSNDPYNDRYEELKEIVADANPQVKVLGSRPYTTENELWNFFHDAREMGFEGLMLRTMHRGYEDGKRSDSLLKVKSFHDAEFKVVNIMSSKDGWAICICETDNGDTFGVSAPGNMAQKKYVLENMFKFIGKYLTVEYSQMTEDNIPFHPTAIRWREDI